jgi:hypothetical protein
MLEIIWSAFQPFLVEISRHGMDIHKQKSHWKRGAIGKFMSLYNSLAELETSSISIYDELVDIALHDGAVARNVIRDRLESLSKKSKAFIDSTRSVNNLLSIYGDDLAIKIIGIHRGKSSVWHDLELWLDAFPSNEDGNGRLAPIISYPKSIPTRQSVLSLGLLLDFPSHSEDQLVKDAERIKKNVLQKLERGQIDLTDKTGVAKHLNNLNVAIEDMRTARSSLAKFIRTHFPLGEILDQ